MKSDSNGQRAGVMANSQCDPGKPLAAGR